MILSNSMKQYFFLQPMTKEDINTFTQSFTEERKKKVKGKKSKTTQRVEVYTFSLPANVSTSVIYDSLITVLKRR